MRKLNFAVAMVAVFAFAGSAAAVPVWYADVQTSRLLGNVHGSITLPGAPGSISDLIGSTHLENLGSGLGSGYVSTTSSLNITHTFSPSGYTVNSVHYASVYVGVLDDFDLGYEYAELKLGSDVLDSGNAFANLFSGNVTAHIASVGDSITLTMKATKGDYKVKFSVLKVKFDGDKPRDPVPAIPEPSAALIFAAGLAVAGYRRRS
jgi:hypothetical protein